MDINFPEEAKKAWLEKGFEIAAMLRERRAGFVRVAIFPPVEMRFDPKKAADVAEERINTVDFSLERLPETMNTAYVARLNGTGPMFVVEQVS